MMDKASNAAQSAKESMQEVAICSLKKICMIKNSWPKCKIVAYIHFLSCVGWSADAGKGTRSC